MRKPIALLLVASCLVGCQAEPDRAAEAANEARPSAIPANAPCDPSGPPADRPASPGAPAAGAGIPGKTVLHATFPKGSLICGYWDGIHAPPEPLQKGDSQLAGSDPNWTPTDEGLLLAVTAPGTIPIDKTPSVGVFSTNLDFGPGSIFSVQATFQNPTGPFAVPKAWAAGAVAARTGAQDDLMEEGRLGVTVKVKGSTASLNVTEVDRKDVNFRQLANGKIEGELYEWIFVKKNAYTIGLSVDRTTGKGQATLTAGTLKLPLGPFDLTTFMANSGPTITAVGPALANCCVPGAKVTVLVSDLRISQPSRRRN